eukprot:gene2821-3114_t
MCLVHLLCADHPLDQLTAVEVSRASACVRRYAAAEGITGTLRFNTIMLKEPPKAQMLAFWKGRGPKPERRAVVWVINAPKGDFYEAIVALAEGPAATAGSGAAALDEVRIWRKMEGLQPTTTPDDCTLAEHIIMADPRIRNLLRDRYGITDPDLIVFDAWSLHGTPEDYKAAKSDNEYAHPLDLCPLVDLNLGKVIHVDMYDEAAKVPPLMVNYHRDLAQATTGQEWRPDLKTINITQPEGPSFTIEGNLVTWQKWHLRIGFNGREGLVLHNVGFQDEGRVRPVLHRASLSEMAVPYGDYGMGFVANSLELGCDCLGHIKYIVLLLLLLAAAVQGEGLVIPKAICLHEEDAGMLWKHTDMRVNHVEVRRNRRLVISQVSTFANYEYGMFWYFYLDGTIQLEMKLTGILSTSVTSLDDKDLPFGITVAPGVVASNHQHLFCVRIDPSVDDDNGGKGLVVAEVNAEMLPFGPENPAGNAFRVTETPLLTVHTAMRMAAPEKARAWKIKNPAVINPITGQPKHLFVTPFSDDQFLAAGDHVVQHEECLGLKQWTAQDLPLLNADPVIWYSFGLTHLPRVEDFPDVFWDKLDTDDEAPPGSGWSQLAVFGIMRRSDKLSISSWFSLTADGW